MFRFCEKNCSQKNNKWYQKKQKQQKKITHKQINQGKLWSLYSIESQCERLISYNAGMHEIKKKTSLDSEHNWAQWKSNQCIISKWIYSFLYIYRYDEDKSIPSTCTLDEQVNKRKSAPFPPITLNQWYSICEFSLIHVNG